MSFRQIPPPLDPAIRPHPLLTLLLSICLSTGTILTAQESVEQDSFRKGRFWTVASAGAIVYGVTVIGLNEAWYKGFDRTSFHFFDDWREWQNMDKMGHAFTAYFETELSYRGARWTGMNRKAATWTTAGLGLLYQTTVEMLDAYSTRWGFSIYDMAYNVAGVALFTGQELGWHTQRIRMKISSTRRTYSSEPIPSVSGQRVSSLAQRTDDLFGKSFLERYLKDYNAQTIWISANPSSFWPQTNIPSWLNVAVGYGAENLYGGFSNSWTEGDANYQLSPTRFERYKQFYLSPDVDFSRIPSQSKWLRTVFRILNIFKVPAPALEINSRGKVIWRWLHL